MVTYLSNIGMERLDVALIIKYIDTAATRPSMVEKFI